MNTICIMRNIYKALSAFESSFEQAYGLSLNEAMVLCALYEANEEMTSTAIAFRTEMSASHTSKVLRSVEEKQLIRRVLGQTDKRQMYFSLTKAGLKRLKELNTDKPEVPDILKPVLQSAKQGLSG